MPTPVHPQSSREICSAQKVGTRSATQQLPEPAGPQSTAPQAWDFSLLILVPHHVDARHAVVSCPASGRTEWA